MSKKPHFEFDLSLNGTLRKFMRRTKVEALAANPRSKSIGLAKCLFPVFEMSSNDNIETQALGEIMTHAIQTFTADELKEFFDNIVMMKKEKELQHRNSYAYQAYSHFIDETDREPSKNELRNYIINRREIYRDAPSAGDGKGWTRVWDESGLDKLKSK
jgi:hypothetical protein